MVLPMDCCQWYGAFRTMGEYATFMEATGHGKSGYLPSACRTQMLSNLARYLVPVSFRLHNNLLVLTYRCFPFPINTKLFYSCICPLEVFTRSWNDTLSIPISWTILVKLRPSSSLPVVLLHVKVSWWFLLAILNVISLSFARNNWKWVFPPSF